MRQMFRDTDKANGDMITGDILCVSECIVLAFPRLKALKRMAIFLVSRSLTPQVQTPKP